MAKHLTPPARLSAGFTGVRPAGLSTCSLRDLAIRAGVYRPAPAGVEGLNLVGARARMELNG
jgi:hypothetical protein